MQQQKPFDINHRSRPVPRIQRPEADGVQDGESYLWAVSYADLLMVLMCFFVIFFSFTDAPRETQNNDRLLEIALDIRKSMGVSEAKREPSASMSEDTKNNLFNKEQLEQLGADIFDNGSSLYIHFSDNVFARREYKVNTNLKSKLAEVYKILSPIANKIELIVIGHADSVPVRNRSNPYLTNNFDLSSLRALHVLQYLTHAGFPESHISAQGSSSGLRNSRSISLRIRHKEEQK